MKKTILLVEDERVVATYLSAFFTKTGYSPDTAPTVAAALEKVATQPFDLILLDLLLPDGDGLELLEKLKKQNPARPVIIVTGVEPDKELLEECARKGAFCVVNKNSTADHLLMQVRRAIPDSV